MRSAMNCSHSNSWFGIQHSICFSTTLLQPQKTTNRNLFTHEQIMATVCTTKSPIKELPLLLSTFRYYTYANGAGYEMLIFRLLRLSWSRDPIVRNPKELIWNTRRKPKTEATNSHWQTKRVFSSQGVKDKAKPPQTRIAKMDEFVFL